MITMCSKNESSRRGFELDRVPKRVCKTKKHFDLFLMDEEDVRAVAALQVTGVLTEHVRLRGISTCPHCNQGFGSASLPIHVRRCRAFQHSTTEEVKPKPIRRKEVWSLVDLCLRFVTKHFESVCMEKIVTFPEAEAALIASLPSNLVHRMVVNLVKESKRVKMQNRQSCAVIETLESALDGARRDVAQFESLRDWAATSRTRMMEQRQVAENLQREFDTTKTALALAEAENRQLASNVASAEKKALRLEAKEIALTTSLLSRILMPVKINALNAEKATLKQVMKEARRHETEATRQLALTQKMLPSSTTRRNFSSRGLNPARDTRKPTRLTRVDRGSKLPHQLQEVNSRAPITNRSPFIFRKRPRADGSKIPYPGSATVCMNVAT